MTLLHLLGEPLFQRLGFSQCPRVLPYCYMTFKSKCFADHFHTCTKASHSCMRKLVAYAGWPKKPLWRSAHRALDTLVKSHGCTCDVFSLKEASSRLHEGLRQLAEASPVGDQCECTRCHRAKPRTVAIVADAGQFYENVDSCEAVACVGELLQVFQAHSPAKWIIVAKGKKRRAWFSTSPWNKPAGAHAWSPEDLFRMFTAAMFMVYTTVGRSVFKLTGLPVGGQLSKVAASAVLGADERAWCLQYRKRHNEGFYARDWCKTVVHLRFVDDVILVSSTYCTNCLKYGLRCIYRIPLEVEAEGVSVPSLDCMINCADLCLGVNFKQCWPPPAWAAPRRFLKGLFVGRFARWHQMQACEHSWRKALLALLWDLSRAGWSRRNLRGCLQCIGRPEFQKFTVIGLLTLMPQSEGGRSDKRVRTEQDAGFPPLPPLPRGPRTDGYNHYRGSRGSEGGGRYKHDQRAGGSFRMGYPYGFLPEVKHQRQHSRKRRTRSSSSSSSSSSADKRKELRKLRAFKAQVEQERLAAQQKAEADAAANARKAELDGLEQRMLKALASIAPSHAGESREPAAELDGSTSLSPKSRRLLEARTDDLLALPKEATWKDVQRQLGLVSATKFKTLLQRRGLTPVPWSQPKKIEKMMSYLKDQRSN